MESGAIGLRGCVIDAPTFGALRSERDGALIIENGRILARGTPTNFATPTLRYAVD